jgi:hypothetical protein
LYGVAEFPPQRQKADRAICPTIHDRHAVQGLINRPFSEKTDGNREIVILNRPKVIVQRNNTETAKSAAGRAEYERLMKRGQT